MKALKIQKKFTISKSNIFKIERMSFSYERVNLISYANCLSVNNLFTTFIYCGTPLRGQQMNSAAGNKRKKLFIEEHKLKKKRKKKYQ